MPTLRRPLGRLQKEQTLLFPEGFDSPPNSVGLSCRTEPRIGPGRQHRLRKFNMFNGLNLLKSRQILFD